MKRRQPLTLVLATALAPLACVVQAVPPKVPRVGLLLSETLSGQASRIEALRAGLREHGYVEPANITLEIRSAEGRYGRLPTLAAELVKLDVAVLVAFGIKALLAARAQTSTLPIVIPSTSSDLVSMGLVRSHARPGSNVTGSTNFGPEVAAKRLELLKEMRPGTSRVALLINPANASLGPTLQRMELTAGALGLALQAFEVRTPSEFDRVFAAMANAGVDAMVVQDDTIFGEAHAAAIAQRARRHKLLALGNRGFAEAGGTAGFGSVETDLYRRGAYFVGRILKGATPDELPIEQATRFELVLNLSSARAIGMVFPQALMLRAERVIA
jgi:putative tryptophan/tyrosine transport system substrate-binding protein